MSSSNSTNLSNQKQGFNNLKDSLAIHKEKLTTPKSDNNNNSFNDNISQNIFDDDEIENKLNTENSNIIIHQPKSNYNKVIELFHKFQKRDKIDVSTKITMLNHLYVYYHYYSRTECNPFKNDVIFNIIITPFFPDDPPQLKCKSTFIFPTLFDNRELLESVLGYKWIDNKDESGYLQQLEILIENLNIYIHKIYENNCNKTLVYYGRYIKHCVYLMNDFIENPKINFYHVLIYDSQKRKEHFYAVLTELYLLLFKPVEEDRGKGELLMTYDLIQIKEWNERVFHRGKKKESVILRFKNGIEINILIFNKELNSFTDLLEQYQKNKREKFKLIQYENFFEEGQLKNPNELSKLIEFKEKLFCTQKKTHFLKQELHFLYLKMIELSMDKNKEVVDIYLDKINKLVQKEQRNMDIKNSEAKENNLEKKVAIINKNQPRKLSEIENNEEKRTKSFDNKEVINVNVNESQIKNTNQEINSIEQKKINCTEIKDIKNDKQCHNYSTGIANTGHVQSLIKFFSGNQNKK
jgi:hypothetical protein